MKLSVLAVALVAVPVVAFAQSSNVASRNASNTRWQPWSATAPMMNNSKAAIGTPARDGCINIPGEAHNSADCSKIDASDRNTAMNTPTNDMAGRPTGTTENAERNARILSGQSDN